MTDVTVTASELTVSYGRTRALDGVGFDLERGITGLLGPNGAGKSTLLRVLATATSPHSGSLSVLGNDPRNGAGRLAIRRTLGYLPQNPGFHPNFTVFEFVDYVGILKELTDRRLRHEEVRRAVDAVGMTERAGSKIRTLSGGMRQRVALAAAILGDPQFVILDEPTVGLDPEQRLRFREVIADLGEGRTMLLSTHQTEDVTSICRQVIVLDRGKVRFQGKPSSLAELARGRVWQSQAKEAGAIAGWRTGDGFYRNIGDPPTGAHLLEPTIEDGYLTLLDPSTAGALA